jgi:hypothetical protein
MFAGGVENTLSARAQGGKSERVVAGAPAYNNDASVFPILYVLVHEGADIPTLTVHRLGLVGITL